MTTLNINPRIQIPHEEFSFTFVRSSGPGGQNVNKVNSKAVLRWAVGRSASLPPEVRQRFITRWGKRLTGEGELVLSSQKFRDQGRNMADCLEKLRSMIVAVAARPRVRKPTKPSRASITRRLEHKGRTSHKKQQRRRPIAED
jgi:ribosome-associated protein